MKVEIIVGVGKDKHGSPLTAEHVEAQCAGLLLYASRLFGGASVYEHVGGWMDEGKYVTEPGRTFRIDFETYRFSDADKVRDFANFARDAFNQSCVVLVETPTTAEFI